MEEGKFTTAIVLYCKECKGVFFMAVNNPKHIRSEGLEIGRYISQGHRVSEMSLHARVAAWCTCPEQIEEPA